LLGRRRRRRGLEPRWLRLAASTAEPLLDPSAQLLVTSVWAADLIYRVSRVMSGWRRRMAERAGAEIRVTRQQNLVLVDAGDRRSGEVANRYGRGEGELWTRQNATLSKRRRRNYQK
jgi:hypothetical protein